jgi:hypothetical protein
MSIPGLFQDYHRKTALAVQETDKGQVEYVQLDGGKVDLFAMGSDQFFSVFRVVETTKQISELAQHMLELGACAKISDKARGALTSVMQMQPGARLIVDGVIATDRIHPGTLPDYQLSVKDPNVKADGVTTAQALCEAALPFDPADPVPVEKPKRHRRSKAEIEAAKAGVVAPVTTIGALDVDPLEFANPPGGVWLSNMPLSQGGGRTYHTPDPFSVVVVAKPATDIPQTPAEVEAWKERELAKIKAEMQEIKERGSMQAAYKKAQAEIGAMRAELETLKRSLGI